MREGRVGIFNSHVHVVADEMQVTITDQSSRQQARFAQNLKAIADTEDEISFGGELCQ